MGNMMSLPNCSKAPLPEGEREEGIGEAKAATSEREPVLRDGGGDLLCAPLAAVMFGDSHQTFFSHGYFVFQERV